MERISVNIFGRKADQPDVLKLSEMLVDWEPALYAFSDSSKTLTGNRKLVIIVKPDIAEELVRVSTEIQFKNTDCQIIVLGDNIPGVAALQSKAVLVLHSNELPRVPWVVQEIAGNFNLNPQSAALTELQEKNKELEKINFELDRFVYSASHDLRSPLTSVLGLLYLLREEVKQNGAQRYVDLMEESILKLDNIIRDIVAYSRNNRTELSIEPIKLKDLVTDVENGLRYLETPEFNVHSAISVETSGTFPSDRNRLLTILNNLISNSLKYRHPARNPEVKISTERINNHIRLTIRDNGIGIKDYHLGKIFDMFYRTSDHSTGSGLGLYIVRETIKKLGGTIDVESEVNQGTTFIIELPGSYQDN